ncbi:hypothetical protein [Nocardioides sp.]|uniref:hypothetical protein n=1 Tax=Nocardioides sp. TaxID=35761 RepID=UPI002CFB209C|nr:hypothetical protein [Nocardioides sp.]HXH79999.1 hypothetical protein [Nocardioides sp.]
MDNEQIIWIVVIALAALVLIGLIVAAMRKKSTESKRVQAQQLREEAHGGAAGLPDAQARADQAATQAEHKRLEAERAEKEALRVRTELDQERARYEDQVRAADRLDPDVNHKAKDYTPQAADPAGPSNIPSDPIHADPSTGRATGTSSSTSSDPDTVFDTGDHDPSTGTSTVATSSADGHEEDRESTDTAPRDAAAGADDGTLRDRLGGSSSHPTDSTDSTDSTDGTDGGTHRA